jgi:ABC-2 type transport system ATP-binding protein
MLEAVGLRKVYGSHVALQGLNLRVDAGEVFCLLGANGAGKTTTINLFLNFVAPTQGDAYVDGLRVTAHSDLTKQRLAYIPETVMLYRTLTGFENLAYFATLGTRHSHTRHELLACLERAGLQRDAVDKRVSTYSKGMRQKVGIAIAIVKQARALLLDEPTSGLDPKASNEFSAVIAQLAADGVAVLMATHDLFRAKESGTRVGIMRSGRLVRTLETADLGHADLERLYLAHMHD